MLPFCRSRFWDYDRAWNTTDPNLTECFRDTLLVWLPCSTLWIFFPIILLQYRKYTTLTSRWTLPAIVKMVIVAALIVVALSEFTYMAHQSSLDASSDSQSSIAFMLAQMVKISSFLISMVVIMMDCRRGIPSSPYQFVFWLLLVLCGTVEYRSQLKQTLENSILDKFIFSAEMAYYPLVVFGFVMFCFVDQDAVPKDTPKSQWPEHRSSYPSRLFFSWFTRLVYKGWRNPLVQKDLWQLEEKDTTASAIQKFDLYWRQELAKKQVTSTYQPSMIKALWATFWPLMLLTALLQLIATVIIQTVAVPFALRYIINFVSDNHAWAWKGYVVAVWLFLLSVAFTVFFQQFQHFCAIIALRMRSALIGLIYRKSLRISAKTKREKTSAEIVNLMTVDAQRFTTSPVFVHSLWGCLLQLVICVYLLYQIIGPSVFAGIGAMLLTIPMVGIVMRKIRGLEANQLTEKDARMKVMNEILNGIKILKLYAWEKSFEEKVQVVRGRELAALRRSAHLKAINMITWLFTPSLIALVSFTTFVLSDENNILTPSTTFVSLALFGILRVPLALLPAAITGIIQSKLSLNRIQAFLQSEELNLSTIQRVSSDEKSTQFAIQVRSASFSYSKEQLPVLKDINLEVLPGSLVAVVGPVGSGKSSLCGAILGLLEKQSGVVVVKGRVAYCSQSAWIQNLTVRENILFGMGFDEERYQTVVDACALLSDFDILPAGDATEIGERGINLSGGQKQRINIARAVYADADVYVLDDPLSAVDAHVAKHIFEHVIGPNGLLRGKSRLLVTHGAQFLPQADGVVFLRDGEMSAFADLPKLLSTNDFSQFHQQLESGQTSPTLEKAPDDPLSFHPNGGFNFADDQQEAELEAKARLSGSHMRQMGDDLELQERKPLINHTTGKPSNARLIEEETTKSGRVSWKIYGILIRYATVIGTVVTMLLHAVYTGFVLAANIWLSFWSEDHMHRNINGDIDVNQNAANYSRSADKDIRHYRLGIYALLNLFQVVFIYLSALILALCCIKASRRLHNEMLHRLVRAPLVFFETTPVGRVLNRFSKDLDTLDMQLPTNFKMWTNGLFIMLSVIILICISTPWFTAVVPVIAILYFIIQRAYIPSSRQIKRLESVSRSPILSHFQESLSGRPVILAMQQEARFVELNDRLNDAHNMASYANAVGQRWIVVRIEALGAVCTFFAALLAVMGKGQWSTHPGLLGLAVTFATSMTSSFNWLVRESSEIEAHVVSVERMHEYTEIEQEAPWDVPATKPVTDWPESGHVQFQNYGVRYRGNLNLVLEDVNCVVMGGEKVGVCGRTGAGKSSLISALFRLVEAATGGITIDSLDIGRLGLHDLRSRLTIIPQDPVLFSGTLRSNLDPFNRYDDSELWHVLQLSHLHSFAKTQEQGLLMEISEGGENVSVGQRQLVCLARALLRRSRILILDEATASIDAECDELIQQTIRQEFVGCTVITVAHRLQTIMDYNRVMVLEEGRVVEFDTPENLLGRENSLFRNLAIDAGILPL
ncbi:hypothetical protein RvY_16304 [Ramazzottius varieornatus]|uniref:ABC-type glutathione-S-conjugate transporter n=1 Tax=Ramazzottius varieornatus TaxID=947166 RepID=A0A1D1VXZ5_RAMVA|nr:hypothetical protein RvY_16304 [Ramazzottius varieornatus]